MRIRGVKRGKTIELLEQINIFCTKALPTPKFTASNSVQKRSPVLA